MKKKKVKKMIEKAIKEARNGYKGASVQPREELIKRRVFKPPFE